MALTSAMEDYLEASLNDAAAVMAMSAAWMLQSS